MVARLADPSLDAGSGRPVVGEEFAQRAGRRVDESFQAERGDTIGHAAPRRIIVDGDPSKGGFEKVHVRIRSLRPAGIAILPEAAPRMGMTLLEPGPQR